MKKLSFEVPLDLDDFNAISLTTVLDGRDLGVDDVVGDDPALSKDAGALLDACHRLHQSCHQTPSFLIFRHN